MKIAQKILEGKKELLSKDEIIKLGKSYLDKTYDTTGLEGFVLKTIEKNKKKQNSNLEAVAKSKEGREGFSDFYRSKKRRVNPYAQFKRHSNKETDWSQGVDWAEKVLGLKK